MSATRHGPLQETPDIDGAWPRLTDEQILSVHGARRFLGEVGLLTGQASFVTARAVERAEVLAVSVDRLRDVVARDPGLGDLIVRAFLVRRWHLIGEGTGLTIVGSCYERDTRRLRDFAARNRLPHRWIDLERDADAETLLRQLHVAQEKTPVVIWRDRVLHNPSNAELARAIGLRSPLPADGVCDLVVVGAGPAGLAASVYGASEGLDTVTLDAVGTGGQTSVPGVFAAGDVRSGTIRRVASAVGEGAMAVRFVHEYLETRAG